MHNPSSPCHLPLTYNPPQNLPPSLLPTPKFPYPLLLASPFGNILLSGLPSRRLGVCAPELVAPRDTPVGLLLFSSLGVDDLLATPAEVAQAWPVADDGFEPWLGPIRDVA